MSRRDAVAPLLAALAALAAYLATLAPSVTLEDSGELITAADRLGIPHAPGYPLYTLLAHLATWLPLGTVAWRVNLLSALAMATGVALFTAALQRLCRDALGVREGAGVLAAGGGLLAALAWETWEQAVIAEVYGLHLALFGAALLLMAHWTLEPARRGRTLALLGLTLGLGAGHHPSALMWFPAAAACVLMTAPREAFAPAPLARAAGAFALGLLPLAYLPLASARDPVLDWGDPDTLRSFLQVVTRAQYGAQPVHALDEALAQGALLARLVVAQWPAAILLLLVPGTVALALHSRRLLALVAALWLGTGPLMALLANFPVASGDAMADAENAALASVFFIPSHWVLALLITAGLALAASRLPRAASRLVLATALALPLAVAAKHWRRVDLSADRTAEAYVATLFGVAAPGALILANWDPFYFPTLYVQHVEGARPDLTVIDAHLLRRSWYVRQLQRHDAAGAVAPARAAMDAFVEAVAPFERDLPYDGRLIEARYRAMIRALVEGARTAGREVHATYVPDADLVPGLQAEPLYVSYRLVPPSTRPAAPDVATLRVAELLAPANQRMAGYLQAHARIVVAQRAQWCALAGPCADAAYLGGLLAAPAREVNARAR